MREHKIPSDAEFLKLVNEILEDISYPSMAESISSLDGGMCHENMLVKLDDESELVLRWQPAGDHPNPARREDHYFGGVISMYREARILGIAKEVAHIPASGVVAISDKKEKGKALLVEKVEGIHFRDYLERNDHSLEAFCNGLKKLGNTIAQVHSVHFDVFGQIQPDGILPGTVYYGDYLRQVINRHFHDHVEIVRQYLKEQELTEIFEYMERVVNGLVRTDARPSFVLYDQHARNFFVDPETGKPSGFYDLEYGQSAHPNLEFGSMCLQLFGFYSGEYVPIARASFLEGYKENGGPSEIEDPQIEAIHTINHIFSAVKSYHDIKDGIRDEWSQNFAGMVLGVARAGEVNCYDSFTDLIRPVTRQPVHPKY